MRLTSLLMHKTPRSTRLLAGALSLVTLLIVTTAQRRQGQLPTSLGVPYVSRFRTRPYGSAAAAREELVAARADFARVAPGVYPADQGHFTWVADSRRAAEGLFRCMERGDCAQNQTKGACLGALYGMCALIIGGLDTHSGQYRALQDMGYTVLFASTVEAASRIYPVFDSLIKIVIANPGQAWGCFKTSCGRSVRSPGGIPAWKIFTSYFRQHSNNPLGPKWTLNPEPYGGENTYLGYSIEAQCSKHAFVPHAQRKRQAYILTRFLKFFLPETTAWPPNYFDDAANATGVSFVMAARDLPDTPRLGPADLSSSIQNLGGDAMQTDNFFDQLSHSVALVGIGSPTLSPTAYDALCLGVPFINPIKGWDKQDPQNRKLWSTQHDALRGMSAPFVYHVFQGDREGFIKAIRAAAANPIQSYVLERMKMASIKDRLGRILDHDWKTEAAGLLKRRQEGSEKGDVFAL
ncbi:hypothetical protein C8R46DRAFT_1007409 [Mycena filopes]|nr:hypothetical protein C8R46DRAFT_1007409 [Mycena filopes]